MINEWVDFVNGSARTIGLLSCETGCSSLSGNVVSM